MGKIKQKRLRISRYSPTNLNKNKHNQAENDLPNTSNVSRKNKKSENGRFGGDHSIKNGVSKFDEIHVSNGGLKTAQKKMLSDKLAEKVTGLNMLAAFALDEKAAESIIENNLISSIANLLQDSSSQVRLAAAGTLRNLCSWGSDDQIDMIVQQDVLQPLSQLLKSYENNVPSSERNKNSLNFSKGIANSTEEFDPNELLSIDANNTEEPDPNDLIFIHATNVLWSLCECNEEAVAVFNRENLVNILLKRINPFTWSYSVSLAAADCLLCVSENNSKMLSSLLPLAPTLMTLVNKALVNCDPLNLHFAVILSGVLLNISYWGPGDPNFQQMYEVLSKIIEIDAGSLLRQNDTKNLVQESFEHIISAQLVAFEILSNIFCSEEDDITEYEDLSDGLEDEEPMDLESGSCMQTSDTVSEQVLESVKYYQLVAKTQSKITDSEEKVFWKNEDDSKSVIERQKQVKIRALQCYQNLIDSLPLEHLGGPENVYSTWIKLGQICFSSCQTDTVLFEALSGAMRAIIEKLSEIEYTQLANISSTDVQPIFSCILSCEEASVKANLCRMIGTLGCAIIKQASVEYLSSDVVTSLLISISETLLKVSQTEDSLYVQAEAIDVLIDLFSDDKTDKMATQIRLVENLREIEPRYKAKFNKQRKRLSAHNPLLVTVKDNLTAFIKYKGART